VVLLLLLLHTSITEILYHFKYHVIVIVEIVAHKIIQDGKNFVHVIIPGNKHTNRFQRASF